MDAHAAELQNTFYTDGSMAGAINAYIMFENSMDLEGKLFKLLAESGFSPVEDDPNYIASNVNWSYLSTNFGLTRNHNRYGSGLLLIILRAT